jgi:C-terminal duplication domain of Friend of PRMT1
MDPKSTKPNLAARIQQTPIVYVPCAASLTGRSVALPRAAKNVARGGSVRGGRGARGAGARRGTGRTGPSGSGRRPKKTVEELDEEMTDYFQGDAGNAA